MKKGKTIIAMTIAVVMSLASVQTALACTILGAGKLATVNGTTITTHNDDSGGADSRLWIIPSMEGGKDVMRDLVYDSHNYGDYGNFPEEIDYGGGFVVGEVPQPNDTYAYLHSRYSFINEKGVAMGETTFSYSRREGFGLESYTALFDSYDGLCDAWNIQDIALEQASTAREAVRIMGDLIEEFGWSTAGENMIVVDGTEVWFFEVYGRDLWAAVRIPDDAFTVASNRARIAYVDFDDPDNYMCSPNIIQFAIDSDLWEEDSEEPFSPADIYNPYYGINCSGREYRAFTLVAPEFMSDYDMYDERFPLWVVPEKLLTVDDIYKIAGDTWTDTEFDLAYAPQAGPWGDVLNRNYTLRPIGNYNSCYVMISEIDETLPDEMKCLVWYGYGAAPTNYLTPLWPSMNELPALYSTGNRRETFDRNSGWWTNIYVQQQVQQNYVNAIEMVKETRDDRMAAQYEIVPVLQQIGAELIADGKVQEAKDLITTYAYNNAVEWHEIWLDLGDRILTKYYWPSANPEWYRNILNEAPRNPDDPFLAE